MINWNRNDIGWKQKVIHKEGRVTYSYTPITVTQAGKDGRVKEYRIGHRCDRKHYTIKAFYGDTFLKELPNDTHQRSSSQGAIPSAPHC